MAYKYGDRKQINLFPASIEEYVAENDPVRAYDAFVDVLDLNELGIIMDSNKVGNSEYDPKAMLKLLIYGYSYGVRSSRKLERAVYHNVSFIWLAGGLKPDHKTIAEFRRKNKEPLKKVLKQCARLCIKLNLIDGNTLFVDGTKMRANASLNKTWTENKCNHFLKHIDEHIDAILKECDVQDEKEQAQESFVKNEKIKDMQKLKAEVKNILKELRKEEKNFLNTTDSDAVRINSIHGSYAGYNSHIVADEKHGLIVNSDVVGENNELNQFANQINQANETLEKECEVACADAGYCSITDLKKIDEKDITVIVPSKNQASNKEPNPFDKSNFQYDVKNDCYICSEGHILKYRSTNYAEKHRAYLITRSSACKECKHFGKCTTAKKGRTVVRHFNEETIKKLEVQYEKPESQDIYKLRKQKVELPFAHIRRNLGFNDFYLRGLNGVNAEMAIVSTCFNIARMISLLGGVPALIEHLS